MPMIKTKLSPINLIILPVSKNKNFIYYNYVPKTLVLTSDRPELKYKVQAKWNQAVTKFKSTWYGMETSKTKALRYSYELITRMINKIDWFETCLTSIPSKSTVQQEQKLEKEFKLPIYYPKSQISEIGIKSFLQTVQQDYSKYHWKQIILCTIGLPLTVPFILLPVVPNLPGFYLCYRIYCHYKVIHGLKHLDYVMTNNQTTFQDLPELNEIYKDGASSEAGSQLLLNQKIVSQITAIEDFKGLEKPLNNCLTQELAKEQKKIVT